MKLYQAGWKGWAIIAAVACLAGAPLAEAGTIRHTPGSTIPEFRARDFAYRQHARQSEFQAVGQLNVGGGLCSGTLIGRRWVLTAAHCLPGTKNVRFKIRGKNYRAKRWYIHRGWDGSVIGNGRDLALVRLARPVSKRVRPAKIARRGVSLGSKVSIIGFGTTGTGLTGNILNAGTKRGGENKIDSYVLKRRFNARMLQYDFDSGAENPFSTFEDRDDFPLTLEYMAAQGDSGGALFSGGRVVGVTSFGTIGSFYGGTAGSVNVAAHARWIRKVIRRANRGKNVPGTRMGSINKALPAGLLQGLSEQYEGQTIVPLMYMDEYLASQGISIPEPGTLSVVALGGLALRRPRRRA